MLDDCIQELIKTYVEKNPIGCEWIFHDPEKLGMNKYPTIEVTMNQINTLDENQEKESRK